MSSNVVSFWTPCRHDIFLCLRHDQRRVATFGQQNRHADIRHVELSHNTNYHLCQITAMISIHNHRPVLSSITYMMHRHQLYQHNSTSSHRMSLIAVRLPLPTTVFHVSHSNTTLREYVAYSKTILRSSSWTVDLILSLPTI